MSLNGWFSGDVKPDEVGTYDNLIDDYGYGDEIHKAYFDGENWLDDDGLIFVVQERKWRDIR